MNKANNRLYQMAYNIDQAAELSGYSAQSIKRFMREGTLKFVRNEAGRRIIPRKALLSFLHIGEEDLEAAS